MAFDGITTYAVVKELTDRLAGGRIDKIYQPDDEEIVLAVRAAGLTYRLLMTAQAMRPRLHLTTKHPENPLAPPMFCMLLRKHIAGGRLLGITQYHMDRIVELTIEAVNELGDLVHKRLLLEIMGKHSNLFLIDEHGVIVDAIRHVTPSMSSVRTVLPGMPYELPSHNAKLDPTDIRDEAAFVSALLSAPGPLLKSLYLSMNGISPFMAREILFRAGIREESMLASSTEEELHRLYNAFCSVFSDLTAKKFEYRIYLEAERMTEFSVLPCRMLEGAVFKSYSGPSELLEAYYEKQDQQNKIRQKSQDLHKLLSTHLERARRKEALQKKQLDDAADREDDRLAGELITANIYRLKTGMTEALLPNFYEENMKPVKVRLDAAKTPAQNAQRYFDRYNKAKRTEAALTGQLKSTREEIEYLESVEASLALSEQERDLENLRLELHEAGYLRRVRVPKKNLAASKPLSFTTSEGIKVLIGKNNIQNDQLTFHTAGPQDIWLHVKDIPGSHTLLMVSGLTKDRDYTDQSLLEAAVLAARHSRASSGSHVPVDYTLRRYVKKPAGARPGFVIYTHQQTLFVNP